MPVLDQVEQLQHPVELFCRHAAECLVQRVLLPRAGADTPQLSAKSQIVLEGAKRAEGAVAVVPDEPVAAHDARLGLGEAALAAADDDYEADSTEEGEAGRAVHRGGLR